MNSEAAELKLFIDNDYDLYRGQTTSILKNLATKKIKSQYRHDLAVKLFGYLVEAGAKKYAKMFGAPSFPWNKMFDVPTRKQTAEALTNDFESEFELGNYDHLLPKKYQAELSKQHLVPPQRKGVHAKKKRPSQPPCTTCKGTGSIPIPLSDGSRFGRATHLTCAHCGGGGQHSHATMASGHERMHDPKVLRAATNRQVSNFYYDEKRDTARARAEGARRGMSLHATKKIVWKTPASKKITWKTPAAMKIAWSPVRQQYMALWPGRGPIEKQSVLRTADAEGMHDWLRATYGEGYGIKARAGDAAHARTKSPAQLEREIAQSLRQRQGW